eukprot:6474138-Amphidinium_carterae.1
MEARILRRVDDHANATRQILRTVTEETHGFRPATHPETYDPDWNGKVREYYNVRTCMILGTLFPECLIADYRTRTHTYGPNYFGKGPLIAEHIYKKNMPKQGKDLGIVTSHPRNGLFLVKSLEDKYQNGRLTLLPVKGDEGDTMGSDDDDVAEPETLVTFEVRVANQFLEDTVLFKRDRETSIMRPVVHEGRALKAGRPIRYRDIDGKHIRIRKPFMAALFSQARYAHRVYKDLPNPEDDQLYRKFHNLCSAGMTEYARMMLHRIPCLPLEDEREEVEAQQDDDWQSCDSEQMA